MSLGVIPPNATHEKNSDYYLSLPGDSAVAPSGPYTWADSSEWIYSDGVPETPPPLTKLASVREVSALCINNLYLKTFIPLLALPFLV